MLLAIQQDFGVQVTIILFLLWNKHILAVILHFWTWVLRKFGSLQRTFGVEWNNNTVLTLIIHYTYLCQEGEKFYYALFWTNCLCDLINIPSNC